MEAETKQVILTQKVSKGSFQIARDELGELKFALQCITQNLLFGQPTIHIFSSFFANSCLEFILKDLSRN